MPKTVFYAWQDQLPRKGNRNLIEDALERSIRDLATDETGAIEATLEQDARGAVGAVEISATLLNKINNASCFVADVTPVGRLRDGRPTPNPNVLFELGYAWRGLPEERILFVFNRAFGNIEELPFDISKRCAISYKYNSEEDGPPGDSRSELRRQLVVALRTALRDNTLDELRALSLSDDDIRILQLVYDHMIKRGSLLLDFRGLLELASETGLKKSELIDCTTVLDDAGLWDAQPAHGKIPFAYVTGVTFGLERYCRAFVPNYSEVCDQLCRLLVDGVGSSQEVAERLGQPRVLIEHVFQVLEQNDYVSTGGTREYILDVKPKLRRLFSNGENQD